MSLSEVLGPLKRWSAAGQAAAIATLVGVRRSAPRPPGARFAVNESGEVAGSISSGCVESDLVERLVNVMAGGQPCLVEYGISDEMAAGVGLACGGEIEVFLRRHDAANPAWLRLETLPSSAAAVLLLGLTGEVVGQEMLIELDGDRFGSIGDQEIEAAAEAKVAPLFDLGGTKVLDLSGERIFAEAFLPAPRLIIIGASPVAEALCHLAAWTGIDVSVIDPREALAPAERFPEAGRVIHEWPEEGLDAIGLDRWSSVVVLAHDEKLDVPALATALRSRSRYVGLLGGKRTQRSRRAALAELDFSEAELDRIHGPVGLDIGAVGSREIAIAIMAELVAVQRGARP